MPVNTAEILELVSRLADEDKLRVAVNESVKGAFIAGGMTAVGGVLLGPAGLALGGIIGGCTAAALSHNKFQSVVEIIADMEQEKKEMLAQNVQRIIDNVNATDIILFGAMVAGQPAIRKEVISAITNYLTEEMKMVILDH